MRARSGRLRSIGITAIAMGSIVSEAAQAGTSPLKLVAGENRVDFTGDGRPDRVMIAHRANYNAHGFDVVTFYTEAAKTYCDVGDAFERELGIPGYRVEGESEGREPSLPRSDRTGA